MKGPDDRKDEKKKKSCVHIIYTLGLFNRHLRKRNVCVLRRKAGEGAVVWVGVGSETVFPIRWSAVLFQGKERASQARQQGHFSPYEIERRKRLYRKVYLQEAFFKHAWVKEGKYK